MSFERFKRREPCSQDYCAEHNFYVGDDGYTYCRRGHRQSDQGTTIAEDTGELLITGRKHKRVDSEADSISTSRSNVTGIRAQETLLLCLQLVLRKQIRWLVVQQGLSEELENVVRDLWTIQLQKLRPSADRDGDTDDERSQLFSSQSEVESSTDARSTRSRSSRSSRRRRGEAGTTNNASQTVNLTDLLALVYVASLILRTSITIGDIYAWTGSGDLLYYQASREVPDALRKRLPGRLQRLLEPEIWLKPSELHRVVHEKILMFTEDNGLQLPPISQNIVIYRWTRELALPLEVYTCTKRLILMLKLPMAYQNMAYVKPEVLLMAALVVSTKLLFPLDDLERSSSSTDDLTALRLDWERWYAIMTERNVDNVSPSPTQAELSFEEAFEATEQQCLAMEDEKLDQYLDWYQKHMASTYVAEHGRAARDADFRRALLSMFPVDSDQNIRTSPPPPVPEQQQVIRVQAALAVRRLTTESSTDAERQVIGALYQQYRKTGDLANAKQPSIEHLYKLASRLCALELGRLIRTVSSIERSLSRYQPDA